MAIRLSPRVAVAGLVTLMASAGASEQPDFEALAQTLLVVRSHVGSGERTGLWALEPDHATWTRLTHYSFMQRTFNTDVHPWLGAAGDRVVVQHWPGDLELEVGSFRVVRRSSPVWDPAGWGWSVQGPEVGASEAARLGLEPGRYGIAVCRLVDLNWVDPLQCADYVLPGTDAPVECSDGVPWPLLHLDSDGQLGLAGLLPPLDWYPQWPDYTLVVPTLSLDPDRQALWRGGPRGVELVPIVDGAFGEPVEHRDFEFPPFDDPDTKLRALYYHPRRHELFLATYGGPEFLSTTDSLEPLSDDPVDPFGERNPVAFTSLGTLPETFEQLLPVAAHGPGRSGTEWTTDLWLYNPSATPTTVHLRRVAAPSAEESVDLPAHASARVPDLLGHLGGGPDGDGVTVDALVLTSPYRWGEQVVAAARVWTPAPGGGTYGHTVTAAPGRAGYSNHLTWLGEPEPEWMTDTLQQVPYAGAATLYLDLGAPGRFRHNLGVVNDADEPVTLTLVWGHMELGQYFFGEELSQRPASATQTVAVAAHGVRMVALEELFPAEVREGWPPRVGVWGSRPAAVWLSMVDSSTGDATFVPFTAMKWGSDVFRYQLHDVRAVVPVVAHASGVGGTEWRTDVYGVDWLLDAYRPYAWLQPADPAHDCGGAALTGEIGEILDGEVAVPGGTWPWYPWFWSTVQRDVARAFAPCAGDEDLHAAFELLSATWLTGWSRTFTTRPDGGTYGDMLPFYPVDGWPVQHFAGIEVGGPFRVNVGLFNGNHHQAVTHRLSLYAADGRQVAERTLTLQPLASLQRRLEHLFLLEVGALPAGTYGLTVLPLDDPEDGLKGRSWAWVSLVDEVTGDPTNWW